MTKTKDRIANDIYGDDFKYLSAGEKASVTKKFNAQPTKRPTTKAKVFEVTIGRVSDNGTKTCLVAKGSTVQELLDQSGYTVDEDKEKIIAQSTGYEVDLDEVVKNNETYAISVEIKSA